MLNVSSANSRQNSTPTTANSHQEIFDILGNVIPALLSEDQPPSVVSATLKFLEEVVELSQSEQDQELTWRLDQLEAKQRLERARAIADWHTNPKRTSEPKPDILNEAASAMPDLSEQAFRDIAEGFALIMKHRDGLPAAVFNDLHEVISELIFSKSGWESEPEMIRAIFPAFLARTYKHLNNDDEPATPETSESSAEPSVEIPIAAEDNQQTKELKVERLIAREIELQDCTGRVRARLRVSGAKRPNPEEEVIFAFYDKQGALRMTTHASETESALRLYSGSKNPEVAERVMLGYQPGYPNGLRLTDEKDNDRVLLNEDGLLECEPEEVTV